MTIHLKSTAQVAKTFAIKRELMGLCRSSEWDASIDAALREEGR